MPVETIPEQIKEFARELVALAPIEKIIQSKQAAVTQVGDLRTSSQRREHFHGKEVLSLSLKTHLHPTGMSTGIFRYETARHARERKKVVQLFDEFFTEAIPEIKAPRVSGISGS